MSASSLTELRRWSSRAANTPSKPTVPLPTAAPNLRPSGQQASVAGSRRRQRYSTPSDRPGALAADVSDRVGLRSVSRRPTGATGAIAASGDALEVRQAPGRGEGCGIVRTHGPGSRSAAAVGGSRRPTRLPGDADVGDRFSGTGPADDGGDARGSAPCREAGDRELIGRFARPHPAEHVPSCAVALRGEVPP
jgi:hypothetical protein